MNHLILNGIAVIVSSFTTLLFFYLASKTRLLRKGFILIATGMLIAVTFHSCLELLESIGALELGFLLIIMPVFFSAGSVLTIIGGWMVLDGVLNPIIKISAAAKKSDFNLADAKNREMDNEIGDLYLAISDSMQKNDELRKMDRQKDEFISLAAHELKTPLTSIKGFNQLLRDPVVVNDPILRAHYIEMIDKNTDKLHRFVLDIVDSSRLSMDTLRIPLEEVDIGAIITELKENFEPTMKEKGIEPQFLAEPALPKIMASPERISQILQDLIANAINYTPKGGKITVYAHNDDKKVRIDVKDTGTGIPLENQKYIFSKFYQVDSSLTRKVGGAGLGLSICKGLTELMGGKIWFESEPGKGTTFHVSMNTTNKEVRDGKDNNGGR